jgi:hypothetical protein
MMSRFRSTLFWQLVGGMVAVSLLAVAASAVFL